MAPALCPFGSAKDATVNGGRSKHLRGGSTNIINGKISSSGARSSIARISGISSASGHTLEGTPGWFSTATPAAVRPDVDDDEEDMDVDGEGAIATKREENVEQQVTHFSFRSCCRTACGAERQQTLIEEPENLQEQRGLRSSVITW